MELNYNTGASQVRGSNLSHVDITPKTHTQATLVRASQRNQTHNLHISSVFNCITFPRKQNSFHNALCVCEPFLHAGSKWLWGWQEEIF